MKSKLFVKITISTIIIIILTVISVILFKIQSYNENRIYNLRKVDKQYRVKLLEEYIDRVYKENSILIIGDSQPNGHKYPTEMTFSFLLQSKLNQNVINLAFQDSRILDNLYILNYCKSKNYSFDKIIFNINHSHIKQPEFQHLDVENIKNYKFSIIKDIKSFYKFSFFPNPLKSPSEKIKLIKYNDYFDMKESSITLYYEKLKRLIKSANSITNDFFIYLTPYSLKAIKYNDETDLEDINSFNYSILLFCHENNIFCFSPSIFDEKYYIDIVHFNSKGHIRMAEEIQKFIE